MRRAMLSCVMIGLIFTSSANAEWNGPIQGRGSGAGYPPSVPQQSSEAQKRRMLLPGIRAATNCIAARVQAHPDAPSAYRAGNLMPVIDAVWQQCIDALATVAVNHDGLHGSGTGLVFVKGPYHDDLPRAVTARIGPELARKVAALDQEEAIRRAEMARIEAKRQEDIARLNTTADVLKARLYGCTDDALAKLIASAESADVLATAAMTICRKEINDSIDAWQGLTRLRDGGSVTAEAYQATIRQSVMTSAVQLKAGNATAATVRPLQRAQTVPTSAPVTSPTTINDPTIAKPVADCFALTVKAREGQFVPRDQLVEGMMDLCRPEIEAMARATYLSDPKGDLNTIREKTAGIAIIAARKVVGSY